MAPRIRRRDFLQGVLIGTGAAMTLPRWLEASADAYPPALTGLRGAHEGSFETAHAARDHALDEPSAKDTGEEYDLAVVGGGISGLAAAYFFRRAMGSSARIVVLDNHDDFGGHAKRNEFRQAGRLVIGYGGSQSLDGPSRFSKVVRELLVEIGVHTDRFYRAYDRSFYAGMRQAIFFDRASFGRDHLAVGFGGALVRGALQDAPLSEETREAIRRLYDDTIDYLPALSPADIRRYLEKTSYADFLRGPAHAGEDVVRVFSAFTHDEWGLGIEAVSALECAGEGFPGFKGVRGLGSGGEEDPYIFHFPDGNASVARLLVRALRPDVLPGTTMGDAVTARVDYAALDASSAPVRIRLNSTAVRVRQDGDRVEVRYARGGGYETLRAKSCVLACWNCMIPYLCPELPQAQQRALHEGVKVPFIYTNVLLDNWRSFATLGVHSVYAPFGYYSSFGLDFPVSLGDYRFAKTPDDPIVVHMMRAPCRPGLPPKDQYRAGRAELLRTPFSTIEAETRAELLAVLGPAGFDPARDIRAITANRWPHGYAYERSPLFDPALPEAERPHVIGRKRFGRISIANSDAGALAYTHAAIDQAHRAVDELLKS